MKAVILAGGKGTRLAPYTTIFPKPMLPVGDRPILDIIIQQLVYYGFKEIILSVGYMSELIQAYYQNTSKLPKGINLSYVKEEYPLGTAGSLSLIPQQSEPFLLMNGDTLTTLDYRQLIEYHKLNKGLITIASHKRQVNIDFGVIYVDKNDVLINYDEKPAIDYLVSMGVYVLDPKVLESIPPHQRLDFPDIVKRFLEEGEKIQAFITEEYWLDIGRHDDYAMAVKEFEQRRHDFLPGV